MDRREVARWQISQARRDILLQCLAAFVAVTAIVLLFGCATSAHATGFLTCSGSTCLYGDIPSAEAKIIHVPRDTSPEAAERERQWLNVCDPSFRRDRFGVEHYVYKKRGCQFGSPE